MARRVSAGVTTSQPKAPAARAEPSGRPQHALIGSRHGDDMTTTVPHPAAAQYLPDSRATRSLGRRLLRGRTADPASARPSLLALLAATALLYLWGLGRSGYANDYYAAAVQAGSQSWKAFFFGSFDSSNFITVDKPPAALWVMGLSARLFGLSSWSLLVPQALAGVATVALLYAAVRRYAGPAAGLLAGGVVAVTPVAALMFRYDNPDALLVLLLTAGAYATLRAAESGRTRWLVLAGTAVGFGFLAKMLQAVLVVPGFGLAYLVAGRQPVRRRIGQLGLALLAMVAAAGWWVAIVEAIPASARPYIGGSTSNSVLQLMFGYNGFGRLTGNETGSVVPSGAAGVGSPWGQTGWTRLVSAEMGGEIGWLLPAALGALAIGLWLTRRASRTDLTRASLIVWGSWLLVTAAVFSFAQGIIHPYYTVALAPPVGALVGIVVPVLWRNRHDERMRAALAALLALTAGTSFLLLGRIPDWHPELRWAILLTGVSVAAALLAPRAQTGRFGTGLAAAGLVAALAGPLAYTLSTASQPHSGPIPSSGPTTAGLGWGPGGAGGRFPAAGGAGPLPGGFPGLAGGFPDLAGGFPGVAGGGAGGLGGAAGDQQVDSELVTLLRADAGSYRWAAAMTSASGAAPVQLAAGEPILAIGGFNGTDESITLAGFLRLVAAGLVHYYIAGGGFGGSASSGVAGEIAAWVEQNFTAAAVGGQIIYDLTAATSG
jgi:4-amino-4-deoxy-L-arabinose transferase-like glycosyltransferase